MIMKGKSPTLISGVPKPAVSLAMIRSQAIAIPSEPASTWPEAATIEGLPSSPSSMKTCGKEAGREVLVGSGRVGSEAAEVAARREDLLVGRSEHHHPGVVVLLDSPQGVEELREELVRERVPRLRIVQGDRRHTVGDLELDLLVSGHK